MAKKRPLWIALAVLAATIALGVHIARSDQFYFMRHKGAMEALAQDIFREGSITSLNRAAEGDDRWIVNDTPVKRGAVAPRKLQSWKDFANEANIDRRAHDAIYAQLEQLGLEGFRAQLDNHSIQFVRKRNGRVVGYYYDESGETGVADLVDHEVIRLDQQWELRRY